MAIFSRVSFFIVQWICCSSKIEHVAFYSYAVMESCWKEKPEQRPAFPSIRQKLAAQLESITDDSCYSYLKLDAGKDYYNASKRDRIEQVSRFVHGSPILNLQIIFQAGDVIDGNSTTVSWSVTMNMFSLFICMPHRTKRVFEINSYYIVLWCFLLHGC